MDVAQADAFYGQLQVRHFILDADLYVGEGLVGDASATVRFSSFDGMLHGVGETGTLLRWENFGYIGQFLVIDTGGHREAKGQEGKVSFHGCKDVMVSISLTTVGFVWMQAEAFFVGRKTRRRLASNVKAFVDERRKVKTQPATRLRFGFCSIRQRKRLLY